MSMRCPGGIDVAGPDLGAVRLDSGDLASLADRGARAARLPRRNRTRIVVTSDLDEFAIAALAAAPVDSYGVGTSVVTGSGAPTAGLVYKLVAVDGRPVAKRSLGKEGHGGKSSAGAHCATVRRSPRSSRTAVAGADR